MVIKDVAVGQTFIYEGLTHMKVAALMGERLLLEVFKPDDERPWHVASEDNVAVILDGNNVGCLVFICPIDEVQPLGVLI